jgi:hypothetical protein
MRTIRLAAALALSVGLLASCGEGTAPSGPFSTGRAQLWIDSESTAPARHELALEPRLSGPKTYRGFSWRASWEGGPGDEYTWFRLFSAGPPTGVVNVRTWGADTGDDAGFKVLIVFDQQKFWAGYGGPCSLTFDSGPSLQGTIVCNDLRGSSDTTDLDVRGSFSACALVQRQPQVACDLQLK